MTGNGLCFPINIIIIANDNNNNNNIHDDNGVYVSSHAKSLLQWEGR